MNHADASWRTSLEQRIANSAGGAGTDVNRKRRQVVFQRALARFAAAGGWVLKGGFNLETRLDVARSTVDLDMAVTHYESDARQIQDLVDEALDRDVDGDGFTFRVGAARAIASDETGNPGWRISITAILAGRTFESIKLDVVARPDEIQGAVEPLVVPVVVSGTRLQSVTISAVDLPQHAAEKVHAYARVYASDRPSSRVKDLVDLVLLAEANALNATAWGHRIRHVWEIRDQALPPDTLPPPPAAWGQPYAAMAAELDLGCAEVDAAYELIREMYTRALSDSAAERKS